MSEDALSFVALVLAGLSLLVTSGLTVWTVRLSRRSERVRAYFDLEERYLDPRARAARRILHQIPELSDEDLNSLSSARRDEIAYILGLMNSMAVAYYSNFIDRGLLRSTIRISYSKSVSGSGRYLDLLEQRRGLRPYPFAERLAREIGSD